MYIQEKLQYFYYGNHRKTYFDCGRISPAAKATMMKENCTGLFNVNGFDSKMHKLWQFPIIKLTDTILIPETKVGIPPIDSLQLHNLLVNEFSPELDSVTINKMVSRYLQGRREINTARYVY